jgi:hypothetical protein
MNNKTYAGIAAIVGVVFLIVAVLYFTQPAGSLPSFFPGHKDGSMDKHMKHGIAATVVGIGCFLFGWFVSGNKQGGGGASKPTSTEDKS